MLVIWKFAKSIADGTKRPRGSRTARVFDTPHLTQLNKKKQDHPLLFSKLAEQTNHGLLIFAFRAMLAGWMPNLDVLVDWPGRRDKVFKPGLSRLKQDLWYAYLGEIDSSANPSYTKILTLHMITLYITEIRKTFFTLEKLIRWLIYEVEINNKNVKPYAANLKNCLNLYSIHFHHGRSLLLGWRSSLSEPSGCIFLGSFLAHPLA